MGFPQADHWKAGGGEAQLWSGLQRSVGELRRIYEHCTGANRRICERTDEKQIWGRIHPREQCVVHIHTEEDCLNVQGEEWTPEESTNTNRCSVTNIRSHVLLSSNKLFS